MKDATVHKFTFKVARKANKSMIKKTIEDKFKVHVLQVATNLVKGRTARTGVRRIETVKSPWKKAIVTLQKGEKIGLFDVGGGSTSSP